jgi:hypothetical protein
MRVCGDTIRGMKRLSGLPGTIAAAVLLLLNALRGEPTDYLVPPPTIGPATFPWHLADDPVSFLIHNLPERPVAAGSNTIFRIATENVTSSDRASWE